MIIIPVIIISGLEKFYPNTWGYIPPHRPNVQAPLESNFLLNFLNLKEFLKFALLFLIFVVLQIIFGETAYAASVEEVKDLLEYWQDQIYTIDCEMQDANLNRADSELTAEELAAKKEALEAKKELQANRREALRDYSKLKDQSESSGSQSIGQKRPQDNFGEGPSKK